MSKFSKRLELDHIEQAIDSMSSNPDFGFSNINFIDDSSQNHGDNGWELMMDFFQASSKYERLENYIQAQALDKE